MTMDVHPFANAELAGTITIGGDVTVNRLGFGAMRITGSGIWGPPPDPGAAKALLRHAVAELGIDFIDTADAYGPDVSEELIAEALSPYPPGLVIATKGGMTRSGPGQWERDGSPQHLTEACEASLRRLRLDRIELYQLHAVDPKVPLAESLGALADLRREGKINHIGLSNVSVEQLEEARGIVEIVSVQNRFSVADRAAEPVLQACERHGLAFIPWFPLGAGDLTKPGGPLAEVAAAHGATVTQIAIAWLLERSRSTLPIPGTSRRDHLEENVAAARLNLTDDDMAALDRVARAA
jgi:aryl-alcohol dehydrogenase-like predicted oxidoreductase